MKVKIIGCSCEDWWHIEYVGQVVEVEHWSEDAYFIRGVEEFGAVLPKKDSEKINYFRGFEYMETKKIMTGIRNGKTTELIKISSETGKYIVCADRDRAWFIARIARDLRLKIPHPVTIREFVLKKPFVAEVLVDDVLDVLEAIIGKRISHATTRAQHIELNNVNER